MSVRFPIAFGRYQLLEPLAVGGMAELFRATSKGAHGFERTVVIKRILPHLAADEQFTTMFINEAKITAQLVHPKIAQTYELGREGNQLFIAMEYVDGLDALALLRELAHQQQHLSPELAVYIMQEVTDALDFAHSQVGPDGESLGIVHRDVSPSNVLLSTRGDVKLVDFGIAQAAQQEHQTKAGTLKGKYGYMSPEQVVGGEVTTASDIFATGIVLSEMLMGRRLFAAPNELDVLLMVRDVQLGRLDRFGGDIPPDLLAIVRQCLRKAPQERFMSAAELRDALGDWLYNHRRRVGSKDVAEIVNKYLDQARFRQAEILKATRATAAMSAVHPEDEGGIPLGFAPSDASSLDIEITELAALDEAAGGHEEDVEPAILEESSAFASDALDAAVAAAEPVADISIPVRQPEVSEDFFDLGDLNDVDLKPAIERGPKVGASTRAPTSVERPGAPSSRESGAPMAEAGAGESIPIVIGEPVSTPFQRARPATRPPTPADALPVSVKPPPEKTSSPEGAAPKPPSHYDSIEAAVASLALPDPDPSAKDFDDRDVTEMPRPSIKKQMRLNPPVEAVREVVKKSSEPPRLKRISTVAVESGSLADVSAIEVLYRRISSMSTGLLVLEVGGTKKEIYFVDGKPEFVSSNVSSELFGNYLINEGAISAGELDMALAMMPHYDGKLGDTLVGLGLMRPLDIFRHLTRQVRRKLVDVCTWQSGMFHWYPDRLNSGEAFPLDLDAYEVLGAGALELTPMFLQGWIEKNKNEIPKRVEGAVDPSRFQIPEIEAALERIDGKLSVMEHCARIPDPRERGRFVRCLYLLLAVGFTDIG